LTGRIKEETEIIASSGLGGDFFFQSRRQDVRVPMKGDVKPLLKRQPQRHISLVENDVKPVLKKRLSF
jgi:hypothetical protein